jgi:hypothetical protein
MKAITVISTTELRTILDNAIVYADYIAGNYASASVVQGAKEFSAECEQKLTELK